MRKTFRAIISYFRQADPFLQGLVFGLSAFGILLQFALRRSGAVESRQFWVQCIAVTLGFVAVNIIAQVDYHFWAKMWKIYLPILYGLVLLTFFIGMQRLGADDKAWLPIPGLDITVQPSEFLKIGFILSFALHLSKVQERIHQPLHILLIVLHGAFPILLIHLQGDDGTAFMFGLIFLAMVFVAGIQWRYVAAAFGAVALAAPIVWAYILSADQKMRIINVLNPSEADIQGGGYQQYHGMLSIGSGGLWGKGLFTQAGHYHFVPEIHNDFIFAFIGEALGFMGCLAIIVVFIAILAKLLYNVHAAADPLGQFICAGVFAMIAFQAILNIGMCLSILPVIGITLPFLSAGGSSVLAIYLGIGLVVCVMRHSNTNMFTE